MITKAQFDSLYDEDVTVKQYNIVLQKIDERFAEICEIFLHKTNRQRAWYDYDNISYDDERSNGSFEPQDYKEYIGVGGEWVEPPPGYDMEFPTRWLWEDFEQEMKETSEKYKEQALEKKKKDKEQRDARKQEVSVLKASIKKKLTPQEWKIVKFK